MGKKTKAELEMELSFYADALMSAREALGEDDGPFVCDSITAIRRQRDEALAALSAMKERAERAEGSLLTLMRALEEEAPERGELLPCVVCGFVSCVDSNGIVCGALVDAAEALPATPHPEKDRDDG